MTAFTTTDIPSNVRTLEQLVAWGVLALQRVNPGVKLLETSGNPAQKVAEAVLLTADDDSTRLIVRAALQVKDGYAETNVKFWENILPISDTILPAAYKAN